ncbi:MAG: biopolymer transporter ExbD [Planctomycetota bacterium]
MRLSSSQKQEEASFSMTPMIDIVFLLIIFFITVTEFSKQEKYKLELPRADMANPDENIKHDRLLVNMAKGGQVYVLCGDAIPNVRDPQFQQILAREAKESLGRGKSPDREVILRADKDMPFHHAQDLILACRKVGVWRLKLQTERDDKAEKK